ncbi:MAG: hypothetical protein M8467_11490 [Anaerolineae bacterium]|nr:hypothetical protein [Anaerolineae bacterium]
MRTRVKSLAVSFLMLAILLMVAGTATSQVGQDALKYCERFAFSTEEDFVTHGPEPSDGNPIISDGDLLGPNCEVCARNADLLLNTFDVADDLGLDAADVLNVDGYVVAFSTELDSPHGNFTAGDLLVTSGSVVIQNQALTAAFGQLAPTYDIGLDGIHFIGTPEEILVFVSEAAALSPVDATELGRLFTAHPDVDILYSTEGTLGPVAKPTFLDGDLLSARKGVIVAANSDLLPASVPAGIPVRGVDFGLDAVVTDRSGSLDLIHFSTEILFEGEPGFNDGDVLKTGNGVVVSNADLVACFEPMARFLGLDAMSVNIPTEPTECTSYLTKINGVDVADISLVDGMVKPMVVGINAPSPFGGTFPFEGDICDDVTRFRVVYREAGSADPWEPMDVPVPKNWRVAEDALLPDPLPDCDGEMVWSSDSQGWFDANDFRHLTQLPLGGCNPTLALTVWESQSAVAGMEKLYEVVLETDRPGGIISDTVRLVQLDNTKPIVALEKQPGVCDAFVADDMPVMASGHISDTSFFKYQLVVAGDGYTPHPYPQIAYYDDATDNVIETGTVAYPTYQDLHEFTVFDLDPDPVKCGYSLSLTAWDRTVWGWFTYPSNFAHRCVGCRYDSDTWGFEYSPALP